MPTSGSPGFPTGFIVLFVIVALIAVGGAIWRAVVLYRGGLNPMVAKSQEARLAQSLKSGAAPVSGQPAKTVEERLAELDDLRERGVITAEERTARAVRRSSGGTRSRPRFGVDVTTRGRYGMRDFLQETFLRKRPSPDIRPGVAEGA